MRRTGGLLNELSRVVYSACDLCKKDPTRPPLWEIQAASAVQDTEHKTIEYRDATLLMDGIPVAYTPWFMHPDPSVPRQSGILPPVMGNSIQLGAFFGMPYYWVIDGQSDATFMPLIATRGGRGDRHPVPPPVQRRHAVRQSRPAAMRQLAARQPRDPRPVRDRRYLALGLRHQSRVIQPVRAQPAHPARPGGRRQRVAEQHLSRGVRRGLLFADRRQSLSGPDHRRSRPTSLPLVLPRYVYSYIGTPDRSGRTVVGGHRRVQRDCATTAPIRGAPTCR